MKYRLSIEDEEILSRLELDLKNCFKINPDREKTSLEIFEFEYDLIRSLFYLSKSEYSDFCWYKEKNPWYRGVNVTESHSIKTYWLEWQIESIRANS